MILFLSHLSVSQCTCHCRRFCVNTKVVHLHHQTILLVFLSLLSACPSLSLSGTSLPFLRRSCHTLNSAQRVAGTRGRFSNALVF